MKEIKTLVDREPLGSDYIASKQDFDSVITQVKQLTPTWKTPWFYGPVGLATVALCVSAVTMRSGKVSAEAHSEDQTEQVTSLESTQIASVTQDEGPTETAEVANYIAPTVQGGQDQKLEAAIEPVAKSAESEVVESISTIEIEEEHIPAPVSSKYTKRTVAADNQYPHIAGYFTGDMPVDLLFDEDGIQLREGMDIVSFDFNYYDGRANVVRSFNGNKIPKNLQKAIRDHNVENMVFITNIKASDVYGRSYVLPAINYKIIEE